MPKRWDPWKRAAFELDGRLQVSTGTASSTVSLRVELDGVLIEAVGENTPYRERHDETTISAEAPGSTGMRLRISADDPPLHARLLGEREVDIGVERFDLLFFVLTNDDGFARTWLGREARELIARAPVYEFSVRRGRANAIREGLEDDTDRLVDAFRAVGAMARQGERVERMWMRCAAELGGVVKPRSGRGLLELLPSYTLQRSGAAIDIGRFYGRAGRSRRKALFTRLSCERTTHTPDTYAIYEAQGGCHLRPRLERASEQLRPEDPGLADRYRIDCEAPERVTARLGAPMPELLARVRPALIRADRIEIAVLLWGLVCDEERMASAAALVQRLAVEIETSAVGPYR